MRYLWLLWFPLLLLSCRLDDCSVLLHSPVRYTGTAQIPHLDHVDFYTRRLTCLVPHLPCTHDTVAVLALRNPTEQTLAVRYRCVYREADREVLHVHPSDTTVPARSTRIVEVGGFVDAAARLSIECTAWFSPAKP
jgi:hypothetical protein